MSNKYSLPFIKTSDKDTMKVLLHDGFELIECTGNTWTFLNCNNNKSTLVLSDNNKIHFSNKLCI